MMASRSLTYKIEYTYSSRDDIRGMKEYILKTFKYRELGENFTKKMKEAAKEIKKLPTGYSKTEFQYRGYDIYIKPYRTYLFFYVVDEQRRTVTMLRVLQDGMNWEYIIKQWIREKQ